MQVGAKPRHRQIVRLDPERVAQLFRRAVDPEKHGGRDGCRRDAPDADRPDQLERNRADVDEEEKLQVDL